MDFILKMPVSSRLRDISVETKWGCFRFGIQDMKMLRIEVRTENSNKFRSRIPECISSNNTIINIHYKLLLHIEIKRMCSDSSKFIKSCLKRIFLKSILFPLFLSLMFFFLFVLALSTVSINKSKYQDILYVIKYILLAHASFVL